MTYSSRCISFLLAFIAAKCSHIGSDAVAGWPTDHHDVRNSGRSENNGPADATGVCRFAFNQFEGSQATDNNTNIVATGVTSAGSRNAHLYGTSDNVLRIAMLSEVALDTWACDLNCFQPDRTSNPPVTPYGLVSSGTIWKFNSTSQGNTVSFDRIGLASADGAVYALNWEVCALGAGGKQAVCNHTADGVPILPANVIGSGYLSGERLLNKDVSRRVDALRAKRGLLALGGGPSCVQFVKQIPGVQPSYSPPRYIPPQFSGAPTAGILLVASTDANLDSAGALHALNGDSGVILWSYFATIVENGTSTTFGLRGVVPAVDVTRDYLLYLGYGPTLVALYPGNGTVAASVAVPGGSDGFVSSPVLAADASSIFIHSAAGTLWRINITGGLQPSLTLAWACDFALQSVYASRFGMCTQASVPSGESVFSPHPALVHNYATKKVRAVDRSQFASGGWPQLMTRNERDALYSDLRAGAGDSVIESEQCSPQEAAMLHAAALEPHALSALGSGTPHARLDGRGFASPSVLQGRVGAYESAFPYATPALTADGQHLILPQFVAFGTGKTGVFAIRTDSGAVVWEFGGSAALPFGRSRSSPALDAAGSLYIGADADWVNNDTQPVLFAWQLTNASLGPAGGYTLQWASDMGAAESTVLGSASPVVKAANASLNELVMTAGKSASGYREGLQCPGSSDARSCSGHGTCDCYTGLCVCSPGYQGASCQYFAPGGDSRTIDPITAVAITLGSLGGVALVAGLISLGKAYGLANWAVGQPSATALGSGTNTGLLSVDGYDTRPLQVGSGRPGEATALLASGRQ